MQALACSFSVPETEICIQPLSQVRAFFMAGATPFMCHTPE